MTKKQVAGFFAYARERYAVMLRKDRNEPKPWTKDKILQQYRFCNVFREDDKVTKWFRESGARTTTFSCVAFRLINRISTAEIMHKAGLFQDWKPKLAAKLLRDVHPLVSGAYIIHTPYGLNKLDGVISMLEPVWRDQQDGVLNFENHNLSMAHQFLTNYDCIGSFIAYEVVTDLNHTPVLEEAEDARTWAAAGPGAARGLSRILGLPLDNWKYGRPKDAAEMNLLMRELLTQLRDPELWPTKWPRWDMRTVEHTLCEFDKYERVRLGEGRPKQLYQGEKDWGICADCGTAMVPKKSSCICPNCHWYPRS